MTSGLAPNSTEDNEMRPVSLSRAALSASKCPSISEPGMLRIGCTTMPITPTV
jgi:hypothetical protein